MDPEHGEENLAYSHRLLDAAAELGVPMVSFGFFQAFTPAQRQALWFWLAEGWHDDESAEARSRAASLIRELAEHAAGNGQQITLEMYEDTYVGTCDGAVEFLEEVGHDACGLNPDMGNFIRLHRPIEPVQDMLDKVLPYSQLLARQELRARRGPGHRPGDDLPRADGVRPDQLPGGDRSGARLGFRGAFLCEHYGSDAITVIGRNRAYIREHPRPAPRLTSSRCPRQDKERHDVSRAPLRHHRPPAGPPHRRGDRGRRPGRDRSGDRPVLAENGWARRARRHQRRRPGRSRGRAARVPDTRTCWPCRPTSPRSRR